MKGSIRERSPGRWAIIIDDPNSGTRKRRWHSFKGTKRQAQIECARLISEIAERQLSRPGQNHLRRVCRAMADACEVTGIAKVT